MGDTEEKKNSNNKGSELLFPAIKNGSFYFIISITVILLVVSIVLDIIEQHFRWLNGCESIVNAIGISCQVIAAIVCCIVSILGISVSLQHNEQFGITVSKLYSMRVDKHFSLRACAIISFSTLFLDVIFYLCSQMVLCMGITLAIFIFCIYILYMEIPYMMASEKAMQKIIKNRFIVPLKATDPLSIDFDKAVSFQLKDKNISVVYDALKEDDYPEYNKKVLYSLLDYLQKTSFDLDTINDHKEFKTVARALTDSVSDILWWNFDIYTIIGDEITNCKHYVSRTIYRLLMNTQSREKTAEFIAGLLSFYNKHEETLSTKDCFTEAVILSILSTTIKYNDFYLLETIRKHYSVNYFMLGSDSLSTTMFALISMYLYYLAECEIDTTETVKEHIKDFMAYSGVTDNTAIVSWNNMFKFYVQNCAANYNDFMTIFNENSSILEFMLYSGFMHSVVLDENFASDWFLTTLFLSEKIYDYDYKSLFEKISFHLKEFEKQCFDGMSFHPSEKMIKMVGFYSLDQTVFDAFINLEEREHTFKSYLDELKKDELEETIKQASKVSNRDIENKYGPAIESKVEEEWGFNKAIDIKNEQSRYLSVLCERASDAINFDEVIIDSFVRGILHEIGTKIENDYVEIIERENLFDEHAKDLLTKNIQYVNGGAIRHWYAIKDEEIKQSYQKKMEKAEKIKSHIFFKPVFILKDGFSFNCNIVKFEADDLDGENLEQEVEKYKRPDGQYVYKSIFMSREDVARALHKEYVILNIEIKYKIDTYTGAIIMIK